MQPKIDKKIIAIYGPTISKKTGLAVNLAKYIWGKYNIEAELVSADPRKVYRELAIGQVPIYPPYDRKIKVHMFKFIDSLHQPFGLYEYKAMTEKIIDRTHKDKHLPIIYGGGAVWMSAVLENWNVPRGQIGGVDYKKQFGKSSPKYQYIIFVPRIPKPSLFKRINAHTKRNIKRGLLEEVKKLVKKYNLNPLAPPTENILYQTIEYREFLEYCFEKRKDLTDLNREDIEKVRRKIFTDLKDFARRQLRWIPKMEGEKHLVESWKEARQVVDEFIVQ